MSASNSSPLSKHDHDGAEKAPVKKGLHFTSQVFDIWVGSEPCQFAVHEDLLVKSPKLKSLCTAAKLKSRNGKMANVIHLPKCNPVSMGYIFEYLYSDTLKIAVTNALEELKQLAELYSLCCSFQLDDLKRTVVENLESSQLSSKVPAIQFLKVIESMYQEESHSILNTYFIKVAPGLVKALEESDPSEIGKMIYEGGAFATAIFGAFREVYKSKSDIVLMEDTRKVKVKAESGIEGEPEPKRVKFQIRGPLEDLPSWADLSDADRMLARLRAQQNSWHQISATLETVTGEPHPIDKLMDRYDRITANWWNLQDGDIDRLRASKLAVEAEFATEKWDRVADEMVAQGAARYPASFLQKTFEEPEMTEEELGDAEKTEELGDAAAAAAGGTGAAGEMAAVENQVE